MSSRFKALPVATIGIDAGQTTGPFEWWRHTIGHGGINSHPLPDRVVEGARKLRPRLLRTFLQEYLAIYPEHGRFDWNRIDPYMDSLAGTGAQVVAAITIKPPPLFPKIDHRIWQPTDTAEWQNVIRALVQRYSVDRQIVTYWEIGNETDIGEQGGSPFLVDDGKSYFEYYRTMVSAIRQVFSGAKVGGPALAWVHHPLLPEFISLCKETSTPLDFVSWHLYHDDPRAHADTVRYVKGLLEGFPGTRPEMLYTEWNKGFDGISMEEMAFEPSRAAQTAETILALMDEGLDWSFFYHVWDQTAYRDEFDRFFSDPNIMIRHWNEVPHRYGLFGVNGEVRPRYFVYQMLGRMGEERLDVRAEDTPLQARAARDTGKVSVLLINRQTEQAQGDCIANLQFTNLRESRKMLTTYRIDGSRQWSIDTLELLPVEQREVDTYANFNCQVYSPVDSVTLVMLDDLK